MATRAPVTSPGPAARRWAALLAAWAIPDEILRSAPESPWGFPPGLFAPPATVFDTPSRRAAIESLGHGGSVLDVGCGGGAAAFALVPPASAVTGVDSSEAMLTAFAGEAERRAVDHREVLGVWPAIAADVAGPFDVAVCHHVAYNTPVLDEFVRALTHVTRRRVVVELTAMHPQASLAPLWARFWSLDRPSGPTADDAIAVLQEAGIEPQSERWTRSPRRAGTPRADVVAFARKRLCLPADRDAEIDAALSEIDGFVVPSGVVTLWWDTPS